MSVSRVRQNFQEECEALINKQINMEFYASFVYLSMVSVVTFKSIPSQQVSQKRLKTKVFSPLFCDIFFASLRV